MISIADWLPLLAVGSWFTLLGTFKMYGAVRGIEGGCGKTVGDRLCGTCPSWKSPAIRLGFPLFFLAIGLIELGKLAWLLYSHSGTH